VGALRLRLNIFKVQSKAVGQSEVAGFSGGTVRLMQCGRRAMTGGTHLSARHGEGQRRLVAGALSCDGGKNRAGRRCSMWACWAGRGRWQPGKEWAGKVAWASWANFHRENQKGFDF
jgi:hypothetical protein